MMRIRIQRNYRFYAIVNTWRKIAGIWFPVIEFRRVIHWISGGRIFAHSLEGGACGLCGSVYDYEREMFLK